MRSGDLKPGNDNARARERTRAMRLACVLAACALGLMFSVGVRAEGTYIVVIENMRFNPPTLTVHLGDRVVWQNKDLFAHTATADARAFDSHSIEPNRSWSYSARATGRYRYGCSLHPTMHGTLVVQ
jgi:plastocyanin